MIEVRNLTKKYGDHLAVDDLSFTVQQGQIYGFLGPNGAGKSTTMNIITGCLAATSGDVRIDGHDIFKEARAAKAAIGYLPEQPPLYPDMTPYEYLDFVAEMKGIRKKDRQTEVLSVMEKTGVIDVQNRLIKNLSKGYKQRVGLAQAILGDPKVIILDEPTVGLDPAQIIEIRGVIKSLADAHTVIFSSHILSEVSEICSQILIISNGKIVAEDTPENLEKQFAVSQKLSLTVKGAPDVIEEALQAVQGVDDAEISDNGDGTCEVLLTCEDDVDVKEPLALAMLQKNCLILRLEEIHASLEDVFMELITQQPDDMIDDEEEDEDEPLEVDAQELLDGTIGSAYDEHEAFDSPSDDEDEADEADESDDEQTEGGDDDAGNV